VELQLPPVGLGELTERALVCGHHP
jgi:hypothetical protein